MSHPAIDLWREGRISAAVALARLVLDSIPADRIAGLLPKPSELADLFAAQRGNLDRLALMLAESGACHEPADPDRGGEVAAIAEMFDRAVAVAPEASVAAYSLGDGALLATATRELIDWLFARGLAGAQKDVLDLGCGIGRVAAALAPYVRTVVGLDVSGAMIAEANRRHAAPNLCFTQSDGQPAKHMPAASFDLIIAIDSMPYLVQAGIAAAHVADASRLLRLGGSLVIFNLSYRAGEVADALTASDWASAFDLRLGVCGDRPFRFWDGVAFVFRKGK